MTAEILLAAWQGERFLPAQLESLAAQEETDFIVRMQDDGSADGTPAILSSWSERDSRFVPAREQGRRLGAVGNFFSLLRQAEGDLILFCDQDDVWEPFKLSAMLQAYREAASDPARPLMIHSDASLIDENGRITAPSFFELQGWDPRATKLSRLLVQNNATGCMMMINRPLADLIIRCGDPGKMFMHDWFIALTAAAFGQILFLDRPLVRYRQHGGNAIGASHASLLRRGLTALRQREKARERIALTYEHTRAFQEAYGDALPEEAARITQAYLATRDQPRLRRLLSLRRLDCLMQSPITRMGQYLFG